MQNLGRAFPSIISSPRDLLSLAHQHGRERLEAACTRAVSLGAPNRSSVVNILKAGLDSKPLPTTSKEQQAAQTD